MKLIDVLREECVITGARLGGKEEVLKLVAEAGRRYAGLKDVDEPGIFAALDEREQLGSTGFGKGIAIPHCRMEAVKDFVVGIITVPDGVEFDALDREKVSLIIFIIAPKGEANRHLKLLSAISQTLLIEGVVEEIVAARTPEAACESFLRHTHAEIDSRSQKDSCVVSVFVQNENMFREILEAVTGIETCSLVVANTENVSAYLAKVPLFADFWRDKPSAFGKVIIAVVNKGLANETVRRIEGITGNLGESTGVMVTVENLSYCGGSL